MTRDKLSAARVSARSFRAGLSSDFAHRVRCMTNRRSCRTPTAPSLVRDSDPRQVRELRPRWALAACGSQTILLELGVQRAARQRQDPRRVIHLAARAL
jgi:hypothetical protein